MVKSRLAETPRPWFKNPSLRLSAPKIRARDGVIQNSEKIEYKRSCICKIQNSRLSYFWRAGDSKTFFLSAEIPRLGLNLPRFIIFDRPFATPTFGAQGQSISAFEGLTVFYRTYFLKRSMLRTLCIPHEGTTSSYSF